MCTVSWLRTEEGFTLMSNRDERLRRKRAFAPQVSEVRGVRLIAPRDADRGGTWIGVNEEGVAFCLLNRYQDPPGDQASFTSRGLMVKELIDCGSQGEAQSRTERIDLRQFQPFTIAVLEPHDGCLLIEWTGGELSTRDGEEEMPLVSSSFDQAGAVSARKQLFEEIARDKAGLDALFAFHRSHLPARGPYSPCMHRDDAKTVSFSRVTVTSERVEFFYHEGSPCELENFTEAVTIKRSKR